MLSYLLRTGPVLLAARPDGRRVSVIHRRVWPSDLDINWHMNQAVYAQAFELGRADLALRSGVWRAWRQRGLNPVVADQRIVYRRELKLGQRYAVDSRAVGVDGRLVRFQGHLLVGERVHALGEASLLIVGPDGVLGADAVAEVAHELLTAPLRVVDWAVAAG